MILQKITNLLFISILLWANAAPAFAHTAEIETGGAHKYKSVRLTPEIYNHANSDLSDVRITDENEETVPYFIHADHETVYKENAYYPMSMIHSYVKEDRFYFDYKLTEQPDQDILATSIEVTTDSINFAKPVELFGSFDNMHWEKIKEDTLYKVDDKSKLEIIFDTPLKYTYYRFRLGNNLERISFHDVHLKYSLAITQKGYFVESLTPVFSVEENEKMTSIHVEGLKNLRLAEISIHTDSMFQRTVTVRPFGVSQELYNLSFNDTMYHDTTIPLNWQVSKEDVLTLTIANGDDRPININDIIVRYYADELVFEGRDHKKYTLYFDADPTKTAPVYDIAKYKDEILKDEIDRLELTNVSFDKIQDKTEPYNYKIIFNVVVMAVALLLGLLILLKLRGKS